VDQKDRIASEELLGWVGVESVEMLVRRGRLRWFGHGERKSVDDWVKNCQKLDVAGKAGRGRSRLESVKGDLKDFCMKVTDPENKDNREKKFLVKCPSRASRENG